MAAEVMQSAARSGFASGLRMRARYELAGPLVGPVSDGVPRAPEFVSVREAELPQMVWELGDGVCTWCAALLDDGTVILANNIAGNYIPAGTYLPHNAAFVAGGTGEGVFWSAFACRGPAERIVLYGQHCGFLEQITKLVAVQVRSVGKDLSDVRWTSPFECARPLMGAHAASVEFVEVDHRGVLPADLAPRWGSPRRGGRHRLQLISPKRYALLTAAAGGDRAAIEAAVLSAAETTVAAAVVALTFLEGAFTPGAAVWRVVAAAVTTVLQVAAATDPRDIVARRLSCDSAPCGSVGLSEALGLPGYMASEWAELVDMVHGRLQLAIGSVPDRFNPEHDQQAFTQELAGVAARTVLWQAVEAIGMWNADPLPIADIEYAALLTAGRW